MFDSGCTDITWTDGDFTGIIGAVMKIMDITGIIIKSIDITCTHINFTNTTVTELVTVLLLLELHRRL